MMAVGSPLVDTRQPIRSRTIRTPDGRLEVLEARLVERGWSLRDLSNGIVIRDRRATKWEQVEWAFEMFTLQTGSLSSLS